MPWGQDHAGGYGQDAHQRKVGVPEDMARSLMAGTAQGVLGIPGMFGDIPELANHANDYLVGLIPGGKDFLRKTEQLREQHAASQRKTLGFAGEDIKAPTTQQLVQGAGKAVPQVNYQPQTVPGEYFRTIGQFGTNALTPGGPITKIVSVLAPALASETAGQATKGSKYEGAARLGAALAAGTAVGLAGAGGPKGEEKIIANATRNMSGQQIQAVQSLMDDARARGVQLTLAEAVQQITNNATGMSGVQRYVEQTAPGKEHIGPIIAARPQQTRQAAQAVIDQVAGPTDPIALEMRGQQAAEGALTGTRQAINARAQPHYQALASQVVPDQQFQMLMQDPGFQAGLRQLRSNPVLNHQVASLPDNSLSVVNEVVKQLDALESGARVSAVNPGGNNTLAGGYGRSRSLVDQTVDNLIQSGQIPPDWQAARGIVAQGRQNELEPLTAGPLGDIANLKQHGQPRLTAPMQGRALYPSAPPEGQTPVTVQALRELGARDPAVGADLTRAHLAQALAEGTQDLRGGPNAYGGANFAANIAGNPLQRETLMAGLGEVAPGAQDEMDKLLQVLQATGRREAAGSPTASNLEMAEDLKANTSLAGNIATGANLPRIFERAQRAVNNMNLEMNARALARALTDPNGANVLTGARAASPPDEMRRRLMLQLLLNTEASKETQ